MKAVRVHQFGLSNPMLVDEVMEPAPAPGEVLVKTFATAVNPVDLITRIGESPRAKRMKLPYIPGAEVAGEVVALGEGVTEFEAGQRVYGLADATYAGLARIEVSMTGEIPESMSYEEGAGITVPYFTAWNALIIKARASAGETVLVHGGAGGVGMAAIQLAKRIGCRVFTTISSKEKADFCRSIGADETINYKEEDFAKRCQELTGGRGVEVIVDIAAIDNFDKNLDAVCIDGRIMIVGVGIGTRSQTTFRVPAVMTKDAYVAGFNTGNLLPKLPELIRRLTPLLREGTLRVFVDRVMPFEQANEAHDIVKSGKFLGKVILTP